MKEDILLNNNTDDIIKIFLNEIRKYPLLRTDELINLIKKYQNGDLNVKDKIINSNLRLVVNIASKYTSYTSSLTFLDLIQEGTIGLMRSIETYNPEQGAFSTYATPWIKQAITRSINGKDKSIKRPDYIIYISKKYKKLINEYYKNYKKVPEDEYIKEQLEITDDILNYLKHENDYNTISIDKKINTDDPESNEIIDFIKSSSNEYDKLLDNMETFDFLNVIKSLLTPKEYYILYFRILNDTKKTLEDIGKEFGITKEAVRIYEKRILEKVKPFIKKESYVYKIKLEKIKKNYGLKYEKLKTDPITPNDIYIFLYLKENLSDLEQRILYLRLIDKYKYSLSDIKKIIGITEEEFNKINDNLNKIISTELNDQIKFNNFKNRIIKEKGTKIYNLKLIDKEKIIDYNLLKNKYSNMTLEEIQNIFGNKLNELTEQEKNIIYKYYKKNERKNNSSSLINREINLILFGYKNNTQILDINKLYKVFINNKDAFSEEQILFLETYIFNLKSKKEYLDKYPHSYLPKTNTFLIEKLELMYYGIYKMLENNLTTEKYSYIKEKYYEKLGQERIELLDLYYGINGPKKSIQEIADIYGTTYLKMHGILRNHREYAINLYANRNEKINIDKSLYHKYILDPRFSLTEETRNILKLFMIENKSYDEISKITGLTNYRISNIVTEIIRKMDNYRFKLISFDDYTLEKLEQFYLVYGEKFNDLERQIIESRYIYGNENKDTAIKYNIALNEVNRIVGKFNKFYILYEIKDVEITNDEIIEEVNKSLVESVTTEREKEILSYYYGIKNKYNIDGLRLSQTEICKKLNITNNIYYHVFTFGREKIKGRKARITKPELLFIEKNELIELLKDSHLPISEKEREIIYYLFGLEGYPTKTLEELKNIYNEKTNSIKRRYMRSIVSILKYKNKEIEGQISYDIDIFPNLKYFSNNYKMLLIDYYKNNMTYDKLSKKYKLTNNQIISIFDRIKVELFEIINNPNENKFDFDFYEKNRNNPNIPFYGNISLTDKIFRLYFGMDSIKRKTVPEIIQELDLSYNSSTVNRIISNYMLAICKLKDGIKKVEEFDYETIKKYYLEHEKEMDINIKNSYLGYFNRIENGNYFYSKKTNINNIILYDMIKDKYDNCFDVSKTNREEAIEILRKYNKKINFKIKEELMYLFDIQEKEFMSGKEINHLYRILNKLDNQLSLDKEKIYVKNKYLNKK